MDINSNQAEMNKVFFISRKRGKGYSIERLFKDISEGIYGFSIDFIESACTSGSNMIQNLYAALSFRFRLRSEVGANSFGSLFHVIGDINYGAIFLDNDRTIITVHDCGILIGRSRIRFWILFLFWFYFPLSRACHVVCISEKTKAELLAFMPEILSKTTVIGNCISDVFFSENKNNKHSVDRKKQVLHIGTKQNKNLRRHVEALKGIDAELRIIGQLNESDLSFLQESGVSYENLKNLSDDEMLKEYLNADVLLFCSLYEGFGMPVIEAQAMGVPVITSDIAPMNEICGNNGALLVDPKLIERINISLKAALFDADVRESLRVNGCRNALKYSSEFVGKQYASLYDSILKNYEGYNV